MTVYNNERYLEKAIRSILSQSFSDFEFLIIDDGSQDRSVEIVRSFEDSRIHLHVNAKNLGQTPSLNKGLSLARGKFVARIDADDVALPARLKRQYDFASRQGPSLGAVGTQIEFINEQDEVLFSPRMPLEEGEMIWKLMVSNPLAHPSVLLHREGVLSVGGYPEGFCYNQDQVLWARLLKARRRLFNLNGEPLMQIRYHSESATRRGSEKREEEVLLGLQMVLGDLLNWKISSQETKQLADFFRGRDQAGFSLARECYRILQKKYDIRKSWGRTLLRLSASGQNMGAMVRYQMMKTAMKEGGWQSLLPRASLKEILFLWNHRRD